MGTLIYTANVTDANSISLSLSGADQDQFEIDQNGKITIKKNLVRDNGNTGLYYFTVNATDVAGNISKQDLTLEVTEQIVSKPFFPKKSNGFVSSNRPPISGNAPNGSTIEIYNDQNQLIPTTIQWVDTDSWVATPVNPLPDGNEFIYYYFTPPGQGAQRSNQSPFSEVIKVDTTAPTIINFRHNNA